MSMYMSTFLDLEAGVSCDNKVNFLYKASNKDFITEGDSSDGMTKLTAFDKATTLMVDDKSLFNMPASELLVLQCFCGWEESVVLHIGWCMWLDLGIKATFITPLMKAMVWIEANISPNLKKWLFDIPGVVCRNQKVLLHTISPKDSQHALASSRTNPYMPICWVTVCHGHSQAVGSQPEPNLFDPAALEKTGHHAMKEGWSSHHFWGSMYDHDLLVLQIYFSQLNIANEIPQKGGACYKMVWMDTVRIMPIGGSEVECMPWSLQECMWLGKAISNCHPWVKALRWIWMESAE
ncbi:hypothetical protein EDD18DRAFT_1107485 [Armillaria luteobubalina]|uniref:Uncharacterized protein n=1 Tax=Armillaria luteobubalina TaxID=153913 RepID=A0AA39Q0F9_9AGAR|nr:hypothetical protein EDD18DRAFT_1107485 [Armillaria luteobubalina]